MNENTVTNADIAAAFHNALNHLWNGRGSILSGNNVSRYICFALHLADKWDDTPAYTAAALIVQKRIWPAQSVEEWLLRHVPGFVDSRQNDPAVQTHRIAWVDKLINEFNALPPHKLAVLR